MKEIRVIFKISINILLFKIIGLNILISSELIFDITFNKKLWSLNARVFCHENFSFIQFISLARSSVLKFSFGEYSSVKSAFGV